MSNIIELLYKYPYVLYGFFLIFIFVFVGTIFSNLFNTKKEKLHQKRLQQLERVNIESSKKEKDSTKRLIKTMSQPVFDRYVKQKDYSDLSLKKLNKQLSIAGWDKYMNATQFIAFDLTLKMIGVFFMAIFLMASSVPLAVVFGGIFAFLPRFLLNNSSKERTARLQTDFPDFISILGGYLQGGMDIIDSAEMTKKYLNKEWQEIIDKFISVGRNQSRIDALEFLRSEVDIFVIQEVISILRLSMEQGLNPAEGIKEQYDTIRDMYKDTMLAKISQRKAYAYVVQGPVLLMSLVTFGLPTFYQMFTMSAFK